MTKVKIYAGICGFMTKVTAETSGDDVKLTIVSGCPAVQKMAKEIGDTFDPYELCLVKPGEGPLFEYASKNFPVHVACPVIAGITKCAEAECNLALKKDASITFIEE